MASTSPIDTSAHWIVCQIGAREHYAVARGLAARNQLMALVTDAWVRPSRLARFAPRLFGRYHADLEGAEVAAFTLSALLRDGIDRLSGIDATETILRRNAWFQRRTVDTLNRLEPEAAGEKVVFAYSYAALGILRAARARGWRTVLGQIDPGPVEARIVADLVARHDPSGPNESEKPTSYWEAWREETALADDIVVNSAWSCEALIEEGVAAAKIRIVPLAYEPPPRLSRLSPSVQRPLRVLFLGQANLRKGIVELIDAAQRLSGEDVEIHVVGPANSHIAQRLSSANLVWHGPQPRASAEAYYRAADVFVLPTHSDGFGLTQLEAIGHGVPVVATERCGKVVRDGVNGLILHEISGAAIAETLAGLARDRDRLAVLAAGARCTAISRPTDIADALLGGPAVRLHGLAEVER